MLCYKIRAFLIGIWLVIKCMKLWENGLFCFFFMNIHTCIKCPSLPCGLFLFDVHVFKLLHFFILLYGIFTRLASFRLLCGSSAPTTAVVQLIKHLSCIFLQSLLRFFPFLHSWCSSGPLHFFTAGHGRFHGSRTIDSTAFCSHWQLPSVSPTRPLVVRADTQRW